MNAPAKTAYSLIALPRSIQMFALLHMATALLLVCLIFRSKCVDPPGFYGLDGCSVRYDPWREGDAPYALACLTIFIGSVAGILTGCRTARMTFIVALVAYFVFGAYVGLRQHEEFLIKTGIPHGVGDVLYWWWMYFVPEIWLFRIGLISFDAWFLFGRPTRQLFARPPNTSLERTRGR
jgi:hypothetical protein